MKLIFCVDKNGGMMFCGKRQSMDANLRAWLIDYVGSNRLFMSSYSAKQFEAHDRIVIDDNYCISAQKDDFCFIENGDAPGSDIDEIIICNWNRVYPADRYLELDIDALGLKKQQCFEIVGKSHEKITIEIYK